MAKVAKRRGRYVIDFYDNQGKRRWKTLPEGTTKARAKEVLREIEEQLSKGVYLPEKKIPIFKEAAQDWLEYKKPNLRESTWKMYKGHLAHHFDELNLLKIKMITTAKVEHYIAGKQEQGMNLTTLRKIIVTFNQIMNYAVRHNYIAYNPVRDAERPRGQGAEKDSNIKVLAPKEIAAFLESVKEQKFKTFFMLAIMSGARQGELFGLKWLDVDWVNNQIQIKRTYNNGRWYNPKSKTSHRRIDLGPSTMRALKEWRLACPPNDMDLIFPNKQGNPILHSNMLRQQFWPALTKAGLPQIRFHDLRHTYASLLIEQRENVKYIQEQLGHSSPTVTLNVYAHLMNPTNQSAACKLEDTVFNPTGSNMVAKNEKGLRKEP